MIEMRTARACETIIVKSLWQQVFGDTDAYIQLYFDTCYNAKDILVLLADEQIVSMLICMPVSLRFPAGSAARGAYIYALATSPAARGKGYARRLLAFTHAHLHEQGMDLAVTVPAMDSLFTFFKSAGFTPYFHRCQYRIDRASLPTAADNATSCSAEAYQHYREGFSFDQPSVSYSFAQILWQKRISMLANADMYSISFDGGTAYTAAEYRDTHTVVLKELLVSPPHLTQALAIIAETMPAREYIVHTPVFDATVLNSMNRYGAIAWYNTALAREAAHFTHGYLGFAFD